MPLLSPVHGLVVPFLCLVTIPLAVFAGITTTLAFSILMFRVTLTYLDIALAFVPEYLMGRSLHYRISPLAYTYSSDRRGSHSQSPGSPVSGGESPVHSRVAASSSTPALSFSQGTGYIAPGHRSPTRRRTSVPSAAPSSAIFGGRRSRRSSQVSLQSVGTITPIQEGEIPMSASGSGMLSSTGIDRDFEGVGGWRLDDREDDNWANINSRLELPFERASARHHQRSPSGEQTTPGEGSWLMMKAVRYDVSPEREKSGKPSISPNSSRVRVNQMVQAPTPLTSMDKEDGYFPIIAAPKAKKSVT
ncbi:hypothetical protein GQ53DRAFT_197328 [Thozetella sp. PMI_491]|nr:hypothetical protein GQ53DRAFT_197328 [Thozetella sp. PMI_491]